MTLPFRTLLCFGEVLSSRVVCDSNGEPKGYEFSTLEAAELAIKMLDAWIFSIYMPLHAQPPWLFFSSPFLSLMEFGFLATFAFWIA